ncbi:major facilitator superfamily domain-containing protein [Massariosphaeria phaeospora]|uniref:Major facilitator superfamily domain-containing protein n=1 Tax=Massariosphaeria phaeospora TaxID=100035 RepID=A0A7C8M578_9PLEO|nr:major facilitator superfamily domain-containing protein [Massariosphaeria phaeospora]
MLEVDKESQVPKPAPAVPGLAPEEGVRGWLCVLGGFILLFCTFGFLNAMGVFQTTYQQTYLRDYTPSDISWIFALQLALMWLPGPLFGRVIDTWGPAPVLYPSCVLCVLALCMASLAENYYSIFLAQGLAFGIGSGGIFTTALVCVGQWFVRRRGLAIGLAAAGSSLGGVIFPIFFDRVQKQVGFKGAVRYTALFIGILLAVSCAMVTSRMPRKKWNPELKWIDLAMFKQKEFAVYTVGAFLVMWGLWAPFNFISSMAMERANFSPTLALYLISIINATSIPGRILPPYLGDRFGHFNVITLCSLFTGGSILALWLPFNYHPSHAGIIVFGLIYGFASGAFVSLLMPCAAKTGTLETLGVRFGTFQTIIGLSSLTGLPIMGAILHRQHDTDFMGLQVFAGVSCLLGAGLLAVSTLFLSRTQKTWKV